MASTFAPELEERKLPAPPTTQTTAASIGEDGSTAAAAYDQLSKLPNEVVFDSVLKFLDTDSFEGFAKTSKELRKDVQKADEFAGK